MKQDNNLWLLFEELSIIDIALLLCNLAPQDWVYDDIYDYNQKRKNGYELPPKFDVLVKLLKNAVTTKTIKANVICRYGDDRERLDNFETESDIEWNATKIEISSLKSWLRSKICF